MSERLVPGFRTASPLWERVMTRHWRFSRRHSLIVLAVISITVLIWAGGRWCLPQKVGPANDPRLSCDSPFLNVRPDVKYVGADACAACHSDQAVPYRRHPMGQSLAPVGGKVADSFA